MPFATWPSYLSKTKVRADMILPIFFSFLILSTLKSLVKYFFTFAVVDTTRFQPLPPKYLHPELRNIMKF